MAKKVFLSSLGIVILLFILVLLCLPTLLSTSAGKKIVVGILERKSGFKVEIDALSLSWFGAQSARGIDAQNTKDKIFISCKEASTDASLLKVVFKSDWGRLKLFSPHLWMERPFFPSTQAALLPKKALQTAGIGSVPGLKLKMRGQILVENGGMDLTPPGIEPIHFEAIELSLDMTRQEEILLALNCATSQQGAQGQIAVKASVAELQAAFPRISLQASVEHLPVLGVDQLAALFSPSLNGLIYAAVGSTIDLQCNLVAEQGNFEIDLNACSPQMSAQLATKTEKGVISLKSPATFNFNLTPALLQKIYPSLSGLTLAGQAAIQGTLSQFSCPIPADARALLKSSFQATLTAPSAMRFSLNGEPLSLSALNVAASSEELEKEIKIDLSLAAQGGLLAVQGKIVNPFDKSPTGSLTINASKLPANLIGIGAGVPVLSQWVGPTIDLKGIIDLSNRAASLSWQSQFLNIPSLALSLKTPLTLTAPAKFTLGLNPQLFTGGALKLVKTTPIEGTLQRLEIPDQVENLHIDAQFNAGPLDFSGTFPLSISSLQAALQVNTLNQIALNVKGEPLQAALFGAFKPKTAEFVLTRPLSIQYTLSGAQLKMLSANAPMLVKPATIQFSIDPFSLGHLEALKLSGKIASPEIALGKITLQNTQLPFKWDAQGKTADFQLSSEVKTPSGQSGSVQGQFNLSNVFIGQENGFCKAAITGSLDLQNISSSLLDALYPKIPFTPLAGPTFSSKLKLQSTLDKQNVAIKWVSSNLTIDSTFVIDNTSLQLQGSGNQISWILTPEGYTALDQAITGQKNALIPFEIKELSTFAISLSKLSLPAAPKQEIKAFSDRIPTILFDLTKLSLSASGRNAKLSFYDKTSKETIQLSNLSFTLNKAADKGPLTGSLDSGVVTLSGSTAAPEAVKNGSVSLTGKLVQTANDKGEFDLSKLTGSLQMKVQQLPSRTLDILARAKGNPHFPFTAIFGEMINATMSADLKEFSGPVSMNINTPRTRIDLNGTLVNGALMLSNTLHAQMKVTPEFSRLVLKEINPFNLSYFYSQAPITLEIPANGFYMPLYPMDPAKMAVPAAKIELGKVACRNEGNVNITLGLLKSKQVDRSGEISLWFAPIDLHIKKGIVDVERTEILLADSFDICIFGSIDLIKNYVDMILGLTAQTLKQAFGVKNLPENYVLTIPMKGPSDNVQINTGKATTKVALLLAWQNAEALTGGSTAGALVGGLIGKMATLPDSDTKVPPAKRPFPWEAGKAKKTSHHEKKKQFKPNDKPLKQILKVIR